MKIRLHRLEFEARRGRDLGGRPIVAIGPDLPTAPPPESRPDWVQASPARIRAALERALALPSGGWLVLDASRRIGEAPRFFRVDGRELAALRVGGRLRVTPNGCPHMGGPLSAGRVRGGRVVCPWHGLALGDEPHGSYRPLETYEDGVLAWVRLGPEDPAVPRPVLTERPARFLDGVLRMIVACDPEDVIANRLDPWHGAHFHPHSFAALRVLEDRPEALTVRVAFRAIGPLCFEVDARFHCPEPRTIVMTIVAGEGVGSVVETHATPVAPGVTAVVEATLATSDREGFGHALRGAAVARPMIEAAARRLWVEDAAYAERARYLRRGEPPEPGGPGPGWDLPPGTPYPR